LQKTQGWGSLGLQGGGSPIAPYKSAEVAESAVPPSYDTGAQRSAAHCVISGTSKLYQAQVPKHLKLLPHLWPYIPIVRMEISQVGLKFIQLLKREACLCQLAYGGKNVERPSPYGRRHLRKFPNTGELPP